MEITAAGFLDDLTALDTSMARLIQWLPADPPPPGDPTDLDLFRGIALTRFGGIRLGIRHPQSVRALELEESVDCQFPVDDNTSVFLRV
ncbi:MAG: hypothetical protein NT069_30450 [Planctomycetota bacterium]|nr:hypothetical protein [Planctomycetota bacterium]